MRQKEKIIPTRDEIDAVIHGCQVCRLAFAMNQTPYLLPLSFGYDGQHLFFHTAREGQKITYLKANPLVCFEFERNVQLVASDKSPCSWGFAFETVIGWGNMRELTSGEEKQQALQCIVDHYGGPDQVLRPESITQVMVWRLTIDSITGKRS